MSKKRILKIMGVALTLAMVFSLGAVLIATPVAADPDEWTTYDLPDAGEDGDYFWDNTIAATTASPGPIARDIDGYFWAYVDIASTDEIVKSTDTEGRGWEVTDFSADVTSGPVVAIVCSPEDEDIVYVADADQVFKTEDGGDAWEEVSAISTATGWVATMAITCLTMGYADDDPYIYAGTADPTGGLFGDVFFINDVAFGGTWAELDLDDDVYGIAASPDFDNDAVVAALHTDVVGTFFSTNEGADVATWTEIELEDDDVAPGVAYACTEGSDPVFVDDFDLDDNYEMFVGVTGAVHTAGLGLGGVYRIYGDTDEEEEVLDDVDADIISLDLIGDVGGTYLLAGTNAADVWYSDDDGDNWLQAADEGVNPAGAGDTYVIADEDIADTGMGWAATDGLGAGMHITMTGGESWVGISLLDSDVEDINDIAPSPDWASDEIIFVSLENAAAASDDEVYRYDGTNWERVWEDTQYATLLTVDGNVDIIDCSPEFGDDETLYAALIGATPEIFISEDGGTTWADTRNVPDTLASWAIIDSDIIIAGGDADDNVYVTDRQGGRAWDDYEVGAGAGTVISLAVWGDTVICGNILGEVYISEDLAETWDIVGAALNATATVATYVGFDSDFGTNNTIYAASDDVVSRFLDVTELDEDWEDFTLDGVPTTISGLAVADGVVYVSDAVAADATAGAELGAVQRTVNPLEDVDDVDETEFDFMAEGLDADAVDEVFDLLYVSEGSTSLWAVDTVNAVIYTIEDLLAVPASGGEADPDVDSATLIWDGFDNATDYDVAVYSDEDMGLAYEWFDGVTGDDDPVLNVTDGNTTGINLDEPLDAGTQYWWQVRATAPVNSKWSDVWTFTTLPATMTIDADQFGPAIGATSVPITPSFGWQDIEEADEYMFELADNPDFTTPIVSTTTTNPVFQLDTALDYNTNYFWRVKAISGTGQSRWATGTFTTMAEPVVAPAPPPAAEAPTITIPAAQQIAPNYIYAIIGIGAALAVVVIVLIVRTRKV